jgi:hypothetical protein
MLPFALNSQDVKTFYWRRGTRFTSIISVEAYKMEGCFQVSCHGPIYHKGSGKFGRKPVALSGSHI